MQWQNKRDVDWDHKFEMAQKCWNPQAGALSIQDPSLRRWFLRQQKKTLTGQLTALQQEKWNRMFQSTSQKMNWEVGYENAKAFFEHFGHLNVPSSYSALYQWLRKQRQAYRSSDPSALTREQIQRLEAIGIDWLTPTERRWQDGYEAARLYYSTHGTLEVKSDYIARMATVWACGFLSRKGAAITEHLRTVGNGRL